MGLHGRPWRSALLSEALHVRLDICKALHGSTLLWRHEGLGACPEPLDDVFAICGVERAALLDACDHRPVRRAQRSVQVDLETRHETQRQASECGR